MAERIEVHLILETEESQAEAVDRIYWELLKADSLFGLSIVDYTVESEYLCKTRDSR